MIIEPQVKVLRYTPEPESLIAFAARLCYDSHHLSTPERDAELIRDLIANKQHLDIAEHAYITFYIEGSRVLSHELVRHRIAAYNQRSQRFVTERDSSNYFTPPEIVSMGEDMKLLYDATINMAHRTYTEFVRKGVKKQIARYVLPSGWLTQIIATWNFRTIRHIVQMRLDKKAQPEFRVVAGKILYLSHKIAPNVFQDLMPMLNKAPEEVKRFIELQESTQMD